MGTVEDYTEALLHLSLVPPSRRLSAWHAKVDECLDHLTILQAEQPEVAPCP